MARMEKNYWTMYFDGSSTESRSGAGVVIESPQGQRWQFAFQLDFRCTNNQAEYEALIIGLEILQGMKATRVLVYAPPHELKRPRFVRHFGFLKTKEKLRRQNPLGLATAVL
ncbi:unnamed protein product [Prunus brigantina]